MTGVNTIASLDIGATKVCCMIGCIDDQGQVTILGAGIGPPTGLEAGTVTDMGSMVRGVSRAVEEAEELAGVRVEGMFVGLASGSLRGTTSRGIVSIGREGREISGRDVHKVIQVAKVVAMRSDQEVIHALPQEFIIDGQNGVKNPVGMFGSRLESEVYIVTGSIATPATNALDCVNQAGFEVEGVIVEPLAASEAVITPGEKKLGVVLVDLGAETTNVAAFVRGNIKHTKTIPVGADRITLDIASALHVTPPVAEEMKRQYGAVVRKPASARTAKSRKTKLDEAAKSQRVLAEIIEPRIAETFRFVGKEVRGRGFPELIGAGVVLTGGGAMLDGATEAASSFFNLPTRIGRPGRDVAGFSGLVNEPAFSTAVGLLQCGARQRQLQSTARGRGRNPFVGMRDWLKRTF